MKKLSTEIEFTFLVIQFAQVNAGFLIKSLFVTPSRSRRLPTG
jgi:hypothetical protein